MGRQEENCQHQNLEYGTHVEKKPQNQFFFFIFLYNLGIDKCANIPSNFGGNETVI